MRGARNVLIPVGSVVAGLGGTAAVGYWIYTLEQPEGNFFTAAGVFTSALTLFGIVMVVTGAFLRSETARRRQVVKTGSGSIVVQAGRDLTIRSDGADD